MLRRRQSAKNTVEKKSNKAVPRPNFMENGKKSKIAEYRSGGDGFIKWCEGNVCIPVYKEGTDIPNWTSMGELSAKPNPYTGRSYKGMWESQKPIVKEALKMKDKRFIYALIVLCWMRGDGKSLLAVLIQLWKFFCFPKQQIMLGANSRDQIKFVHFDIMKDIILNSPKLLMIVGKNNIQEKEIRLRNSRGDVVSMIRAISSFSGIVSNITGFTFSEIFDMKNPRFYSQLYGSIRNMPNALGVIDSTVSDKQHILYQLYNNWKKGLNERLFFSYRSSPNLRHDDFWNPQMTQQQLNSYSVDLPIADVARYFKNIWEAGSRKIFPPEAIMASRYLGIDKHLKFGEDLISVCRDYLDMTHKREKNTEIAADTQAAIKVEKVFKRKLGTLNERLWPVKHKVNLNKSDFSQFATLQEVQDLSELYQTDFAILSGCDRADPQSTGSNARTIFTVVAKGLPGSKKINKKREILADDNFIPKYIYITLGYVHVYTSSLEDIKECIKEAIIEYDTLDSFCSERWGVWDLIPWLEEQAVQYEIINPTYDIQRAAFSEFYNLLVGARFKMPPHSVTGSKTDDLCQEEAEIFDHDSIKRKYGSPQKGERYGIQDDSIYSLGYAIYGGRELNVMDFREIRSKKNFGWMAHPSPNSLYGNYTRRTA